MPVKRLSLGKLVEQIARMEATKRDDLLYYSNEYRVDFRRALHKAMRLPEDYDPIPSHRRVKPSISGDELSDFTLKPSISV